MVLYIPLRAEWQTTCAGMVAAGFTRVASCNPYWDDRGRTYEDPDGYRVVLQQAELLDHVSIEDLKPITLHCGPPEIFSGHGILLPCIAGMHDFHALREQILGRITPRTQHPHITLAHPRNPQVPENSLAATTSLVRGDSHIKWRK